MPSNRPKLNWIELTGIRSFGVPQRIEFGDEITCIWATNSQGKTSLAEAFEFLLQGEVCRRTLTGSSVEEFAGSLRNAHVSNDVPTSVTLELVGPDGATHTVRRTLTADYGRRNDCASTLEVDGAAATPDRLLELGLHVRGGPASGHVLMQHTLTYLFSVRPTDRADFFKAILDVTDLEELRGVVAASTVPAAAPCAEAAKFERAVAIPGLAPILSPLRAPPKSLAAIEAALDWAVQALLTGAGQSVAEDPAARRKDLAGFIEAERTRTFRLGGFDRTATPACPDVAPDVASLEALSAVRDQIDTASIRVSQALDAVLRVPSVAAATGAMDCPVCDSAGALTIARIHAIRATLRTTQQAQEAHRAAEAAVTQIRRRIGEVHSHGESALPKALQATSQQRRGGEFTTAKMRALLGEGAAELLTPWLRQLRKLLAARTALNREFEKLGPFIDAVARDLGERTSIETMKAAIQTVADVHERLRSAGREYDDAAAPLRRALERAVEERSETNGWTDLLDLFAEAARLRDAFRDAAARAVVAAELSEAIEQVDEARGQIMDENFARLSAAVVEWWELLRPDEPSFFESVARRPGAVRTIDFRAGLAPTAGRAQAKIREAVAVFSHSQLHCLGLAMFLARAEADGFGFVVLDDPIISSDESHRAPFLHNGITRLIDEPVQVVLLTQDQDIFRDLANLYHHRDLLLYHLSLLKPEEGTIVEKHDGSVKARLARAHPYTRSDALPMRKIGATDLRDIAEFVLKVIITKGAAKLGKTVDVSGLAGSIETLVPMAAEFITDPQHVGQLRFLSSTLSPGKHDDEVPAKGALMTAHGIIKDVAKTYDA